ncbi:hypothetical protein EVAR_44887_1 [Eumeta japonica]|uniref:Uncharacterized protein n=1 Tax=Eumeta variegata TaxID=151549 RepID=A0A4C1XIR5_EUMVA|nr:hypothetical protein EVAR_44887_1 [Eumeta japonica]
MHSATTPHPMGYRLFSPNRPRPRPAPPDALSPTFENVIKLRISDDAVQLRESVTPEAAKHGSVAQAGLMSRVRPQIMWYALGALARAAQSGSGRRS